MRLKMSPQEFAHFRKILGYKRGEHIDNEIVYEKYDWSKTPKHLIGWIIKPPSEEIYIIAFANKDRWLVLNIGWDVAKILNDPVIFPTREEALRYSYEYYLMEKLKDEDVRWVGPEPEEFL